MGFGDKILTSIICVSSLTGVSECSRDIDSKTYEIEENLKSENVNTSEIPNIFETQKRTEKQISICLSTDDENSFTHTNVLRQVSNPQNTILEYPVNQLFQKYRNRPHPLVVQGVKKNFRSLLGSNGIEALSSRIPQKLSHSTKKITSDTQYDISDTLRFQSINQSLKGIFPQYLPDQLKEDGFQSFSDPDSLIINRRIIENKLKTYISHFDSNGNNLDFIYDIVVKKLPSGKSALALYRNGELFMASYVSIGLNSKRTKTGQFKILGKEAYKRSYKYDNAAMPEALNIGDGFYFHQGLVTGYEKSHGCIRVPGIYMDVLYSSIKDPKSTDVFISKNLYKSEK